MEARTPHKQTSHIDVDKTFLAERHVQFWICITLNQNRHKYRYLMVKQEIMAIKITRLDYHVSRR